jgi:cytochrome c-type biogenesis protein CcmH/NrfG
MSGSAIEERIAQTERDLAEIAEQVDQGELDADTAATLQRRYEAERETLLSQLGAEAGADPETPDTNAAAGVSGLRLLGIGAALVAVIAGALWLVALNTEDQSAAEGVAEQVVTGDEVNLDDISNEQMEAVVAQSPNVPGMRLALADRYFAEGDFTNALTHYMYVLETLEVKDPAALANVGWMTYLSQVPDVAESFVEESLRVQPDGGIAFWYLANIRFYGLGDAAGSVEPLQRLLGYDNLPDELRVEAEGLLTEVEAAL